MNAPTVTLPSYLELTINLSDEQFWQLCENNRDWNFERTASGELIIMAPTGGETGNRNIELSYQVQGWSRQNNLGKAFDSSTGFKLPNGANRSPDASWIRMERWESLTQEQRQKFLPLCPDFVVELCFPSDSLTQTQKKMGEYIANGTLLGWLIYPETRRVEIYRPGRDVKILDNPTKLSGENILPGFTLDLSTIM